MHSLGCAKKKKKTHSCWLFHIVGDDICCLHRLRSTALKPWVHCCAPEGEMKEVFTADPKLPCSVLAINVLNDLGWSQQGHRALQIPLCYGCSLPISEIKGWTSGSLFNIGFFLRQIFFFFLIKIKYKTEPELLSSHPSILNSGCPVVPSPQCGETQGNPYS